MASFGDDIQDAETIEGVEDASRELIAWLRKIIDKSESEEALRLQLHQIAKTSGESPSVESFVHSFDTPVEDLVKEVLEAAMSDIEGGHHLGKVKYCLRVMGQEARRNFILTVPIRAGSADEWGTSHLPNENGLVAQQMEHNQVLVETVVRTSGQSNGLLVQIIRDLREEITALKRHEFEMRRHANHLMDGSVKREMMYDEHRQEQERKNKFTDGFMKMAPPAIAALVAGPQAAQAVMAMMAATGGASAVGVPGTATDVDILDEMTLELEREPEVLQAIMQGLQMKPKLFALFAELHKRSSARREGHAQAQQAAQQSAEQNNGQNGNGNGAGFYGNGR